MDPNTVKLIRRNLKKARRKAGLTEGELALRAGFTRQTILRWEGTIKPSTTPSLSDAARLLPYLPGVTLDWIVGNDADAVTVLSNVALKVERQIDALPAMIDRLLAELAEARQAVIVGHEAKVAAAVAAAEAPTQEAVDA